MQAPIEEWPPTEASWYSAVGVSKIRFRRHQEGWASVQDARWTSDALVAPWWPLAPATTLFGVAPHDAPSETLTVAWSEIERIDRRQGNYSDRGVLLGGIVGMVTMLLLNEADEDHTIAYFTLGLPASVIAGEIIGSSIPRWDPAYCESGKRGSE